MAASAVEILFKADIRNVDQAIASVGKSLDKLSRTGQSAAERSFRVRMKGEQDVARQAEKSAKEASRAQERQAREDLRVRNQVNRLEIRDWQDKEREKTREAERSSRDRERILKREAAEAKRTLEAAQRERESKARTFGSKAGGFVSGVMGTAGRIAGTVGAIGGGFALVDALGQGIRQQAMAGQIVRSSQNTGGLTAHDVEQKAHAVAIATGGTKEGALSGIDRFVRRTGDLKTAIDMIEQLGKMAASSGAELDDLGTLGAEVFSHVGNQEGTSKAMLAILGQAKSGAVDIRDLGQYGSRLVANADFFEGDKVHNIETMGALTQIARGKGGKIDAAEATESVSSILTELASKKQSDLAAHGLGKIRNESTGKLMAPEKMLDALVRSFSNSKGMVNTLGLEHFLGRRAGAVAAGIGDTINDKGGLKAGGNVFDVINAQRNPMSMADVNAGNAARREEKQAKINEAMEKLTHEVNEQLLPELPKLIKVFEDMIPTIKNDIIPAIKAFADMLSKHPWGTIIGTAIVAQIASAGIPALISAVFTRAAAALLPGAAAQVVSTAAGGAGAAVAGGGAGLGAMLTGVGAAGVGLVGAMGAGLYGLFKHQQGTGEQKSKDILAMPAVTKEQQEAKRAALQGMIGRVEANTAARGSYAGAGGNFDKMTAKESKAYADQEAMGAAKSIAALKTALDELTKSATSAGGSLASNLSNPNAAGRRGEQGVTQ
jgi:hypothetical protein